MTLNSWLRRYEISIPQFASMTGVSRQTIHYLCNGKRRPSLAMIERIQTVTGGQVRAEDWLVAARIPAK